MVSTDHFMHCLPCVLTHVAPRIHLLGGALGSLVWAGVRTVYVVSIKRGSLVHMASCHSCDRFVIALGQLGRLAQLPPPLTDNVTF